MGVEGPATMGLVALQSDPWEDSLGPDKNNSVPIFELREKIRPLCYQFIFLYKTETDLHKYFLTLKQGNNKQTSSH